MAEPGESVWDAECDFLAVGSGSGALVGALTAATAGLRTIVIEKMELFGGTSAHSGGGIWLPGNSVEIEAGIDDSPELGDVYLRSTIGDRTTDALRDAYFRGLMHVLV